LDTIFLASRVPRAITIFEYSGTPEPTRVQLKSPRKLNCLAGNPP